VEGKENVEVFPGTLYPEDNRRIWDGEKAEEKKATGSGVLLRVHHSEWLSLRTWSKKVKEELNHGAGEPASRERQSTQDQRKIKVQRGLYPGGVLRGTVKDTATTERKGGLDLRRAPK